MLLSNLSIKRPVFASVMMFSLVALGLFSYRRLAVDMFPDVDVPIISIVTQYKGAAPETVEREVTKRIEEAVNPISGVKHVISVSRESVSNVLVEFHLEVRLNDVAQEIRAKVAAIRGDLPREIEEPIIQKLNFLSLPIISLSVRSDTLSLRELSTLAEKKIKRRIESISGVGKIDLVGLSKREVEVRIDPGRLDALGLGVDTVIAGLRSENVRTPLGRLKRDKQEFPLRIQGKPDAVPYFQQMVIGSSGGRPITLDEVAEVVDGIEEQRSLAFVGGVPAIGIDIFKQSGANTVQVVDTVQKTLSALQQELPPAVRIEMVRDGSIIIRDSVKDVQRTMFEGGFLTLLIVFLFLNSWRSTVITGLTLPISVIASFIVMNFGGMTLNIVTLMALSLSIGLLIDDAIVVRENIVRHLERGKDHFSAARDGTSEIGLAVMATTFSIVAVFIPVAYMRGFVGRMLTQFGITVAFAVLVSLFVSFTLDPMLSSRWVDPDISRSGRRNLVFRLLDRFNTRFETIAEWYRGVIRWSLNHRIIMMIGATLAFAVGIAAFFTLPSDFFQNYDQAEFQINFTTSPDASIDETHARLDEITTMLKSIPEVHHIYGTIGAGDAGTVRDGIAYVKLIEKNERRRSQRKIQEEVRRRLFEIPGIQFAVLEFGPTAAHKIFEVNIQGEEIPKLKAYSAKLKKEMQKIHGIVDIEMTLEHEIPELQIEVDRWRAAGLGIMTDHIVGTVGALVGGQAVTTYEDEDGDAVNVRVRLPGNLRRDLAQIAKLNLKVPQRDGSMTLVPLGDLIRSRQSATPSEINRRDLTRQVAISANLDGIDTGSAIREVQKIGKSLNLAPGYRLIFSGQAEDMVETWGYMAEALLMAVIFVYLVLAAQFESFIEPLAIMLSLPLSIIGMSVMLRLTGDAISIMSLIGLIMLMGLVTKNAILLVDYTKILRADGIARIEALITAGRTRFRPILMTTFSMIFGMLPLALGIGAGAELRAPMARAVIGGLITSTLLTLLMVPVLYTLLDDFSEWAFRKRRKASEGSR